MTEVSRYALFYAPPKGSALAAFGAQWLGWDAERGEAAAHPDMPGLPVPVAQITRTPRKYGFHGTLKPPFRLAEGRTEAELIDAAASFAANRPRFQAPALKLHGLGAFLALIPSGDAPDLADFASACVRNFEPFRAPLTDADLSRRRAAGLSDRQEAYLQNYGYPYVLEEFRFHLTLSGRLEPEIRDAVAAPLSKKVSSLLEPQFSVSELCLFAEMADTGRFRILRRFALEGSAPDLGGQSVSRI